MRRQCVIGAAGIVAGTLASVGAEEDAASIDDLCGQLVVVVCLNDQMLRCVGIAQSHHLIGRTDEHTAAVVKGFLGDVLAWKEIQLTLYFDLNISEELFTRRDEQHLRIDAMLGLRQQISSHKGGIGTFVGQHADF